MFWIGLSLAFALYLWQYQSAEIALQFLAGYTIEKALSVDNLFVFLMLFTHFKIKPKLQRRVLNYGIMGVIILRGVMIFAGIGLVNEYEWLMYIFGVLILYTGFVMSFGKEEEFDPDKNRIIKLTRKFMNVTNEYDGDKFFTMQNGKRFATPLFVVLLVVELTDVLFAIDSIPAVFAVTRDPMIVFSSNMLAVFGLRSLYFLLERMQQAFRFVKKGVGIILWFVGVKMLIPLFIPHYHIPVMISLMVIIGILLGSILLSALINPDKLDD
jgi:tellurite resistance protein TerC